MGSQQRDFCCLSAPNQDAQDQFEDHSAYLAHGGYSFDQLGDASGDKQRYVPVNIIEEPVMRLIACWEDSMKKDAIRMDTLDMLTTAPSFSSDVCEPEQRFHSGCAPPKRFVRTFWRSLSKRYVRATACE
jgi:hypothetical protein